MVDNVHELIQRVSPYYSKGEDGAPRKPDFQTKLVYDSSTETLEPVYFWIIDAMEGMGFKIEKVFDNFESSPGSGHFSELGMRSAAMQNQAITTLGHVNTIIRSVLNIIYDLKEFKTRLKSYTDLKLKDKLISEAARLSLKQIWMDKVDIQKGNSSLKAMGLGQAGFTTLIDAFLYAADEKAVDKLDLNERVKRILKPRIHEFNNWISESERELKKRYELERNYLKGQVASLKLYTKWARPYIKAAEELSSKEFGGKGRGAALVKTFNTILLELTLMGISPYKTQDKAKGGDLPKQFAEQKFLKSVRNYNSCMVVDLFFRGIPQKAGQQNYVFGGKVEVTFSSYSLNDDEIKMLHQELEDEDIKAGLGLVDGITEDSLKQIQEELDYFLQDKDMEEKENESKKKDNGANPLLALIGYYDKGDKKKKEEKGKDEKIKEVKKDNWAEKEYLRKEASAIAKKNAFDLFDVYKKTHGMASYT